MSAKNFWLATVSALVISASAPAFAQDAGTVTVTPPAGPAEQAGQQGGAAVDNAAQSAGQAIDNATTTTTETTTVETPTTETAATEPEGPAEGTPVEGQIMQQSADQLLASTLLDSTVMNAANEEVGDVNDLVMSKEGQVEGVVIGAGGFIGVGEKNVAIEFSRLSITQDENGELAMMLDTTADELEAAPAFVTAEDAESNSEASMTTPAGGATVGGEPATPAPAAQ